MDWAIRDTLPDWAAAMVMHRAPNPIERIARRSAVWAVINGLHTAMGPLPEFGDAQARVAEGTTCAHTLPSYVLGSDPERDRELVEQLV